MMTDSIADMLTRIRNASSVRKGQVEMPYSKLKQELARVLKEERYIKDFQIGGEGVAKSIVIDLMYHEKLPAIRTIKRLSKPGCRLYVKAEHIPVIMNNLGISILSTSRGIMTNKQARKLRVGGELLCEIS